ncbi:MAG: hypothetical protein JXA90_03235 [Planctomycetes bacterium]|nr:hypothetical protein [Planctomycetota bacterium]
MRLFKSREQRRIEREIQIRKGIHAIRKNIQDLGRNEKEYARKARRAQELGSPDQVEFLKKTLKRTAGQKRLMERQLLNIETANQIKNQAEAHAGFARAMNALSRSIRESFGAADMARTTRNFEMAMAQADSLEAQMELFLDMSSQSMFGYEPSGEEIVTDAEIDAMIAAGGAEPSSAEVDRKVADGLAEIRREIGEEAAGDEPPPR